MTISQSFSVLLIALASHNVLACGDIAAEPIQGERPDALSSPSNDPYACELVPTGATAGYTYRDVYTPTCKLTGAPCLADGNGSRTVDPVTGVISAEQTLQMVCEHLCQTDDDCPAPESGTAVATCVFIGDPSAENTHGSCVVSCDAGETCQDGFECRESRGPGWPSSCVGEAVTIEFTGTNMR